jgi:hypothetical protein
MKSVVEVTRERSLLPTGNTTSTFELRAGTVMAPLAMVVVVPA